MDDESLYPPKRRFRWRVLPVGLLVAFGLLFVLTGLFSLFVMTYTTLKREPLYTPGPMGFSYQGMNLMASGIAIGTWLLVASQQWWKGYWRTALVMVGIVIGGVAGASWYGLLPD